MSGDIGRRALLIGGSALALTRNAFAKGRSPIGGRVSFRMPWPVTNVDPHRLDDPMAAFFGEALFDTLYAKDGDTFTASLAEGDPEPDGPSLRVKLRAGLRTGKGASIDPRDVVASLARARNAGAKGWLADIGQPRADGRSLVFPVKDSARLVRALAAPICAIVPSAFSPDAPDGTGPFRFTTRGDASVLSRNPNAARGPAFLEEVSVRAASNREASLRSFEAGTDDIGWHGLGIGGERRDAKAFDVGAAGFAVLYTGKDASDWDAPGVAQRVADAVLPSRVKEFNLGADWTADASQGWGGPATSIIVRDDAPWLVDLANAVAILISRPGHEVTVKSVSDLAARRSARNFGLCLDLVRPVTAGSFGAMMAFTTADNPNHAGDVMLHPPKVGEVSVRTLTRTLRCGVIGEIRIQGGRANDLHLPTGSLAWDLGAATRVRLR